MSEKVTIDMSLLESLDVSWLGQIEEYLRGERREFVGSLEQEGTEFQKKVWRAISDIPYGEVMSYKEIAEKVGRSGAVRAVGTACGKNKLPIVVPCHRVVASGGKLGGYAFGLEMKKKLLALEGVVF